MFRLVLGKQFGEGRIHGALPADFRLEPQELSLIASAKSIQYQLNFKRGRCAARQAFRELGMEQPDAILRGRYGEPLWPKGFVGSISHSGDTAVAVVTQAEHAAGVGIDIQYLKRQVTDRLVGHVCTSEEQAWVSEILEDRNSRFLRIFSAKECIFKAIFPICQTYFGFQDAELTWSNSKQGFVLRLRRDLKPPFVAGYRLWVHSNISHDMISSCTTVPVDFSQEDFSQASFHDE